MPGRALRACWLVCGVLALTAAPMAAQELPSAIPDTAARVPAAFSPMRRLSVFDATSLHPLAEVNVQLRGADGTGPSWTTGIDGTVSLPELPTGRYVLQLRRLGYQMGVYLLDLTAADSATLHTTLEVAGVKLATVVSTGERVPARLLSFYERRAMTTGGRSAFITAEEMDRRRPIALSDLLRDRGTSAFACRNGPIWVNGALLASAEPSPMISTLPGTPAAQRSSSVSRAMRTMRIGGSMLDTFSIDEIAAMEVYWGAGNIPAQYNMTGGGGCALVLWTK